ncbi:MAG TPA: efflux RND transporter periplasmic adaptor subunit [Chitinophagaceae bacterium]|nr:efflux RND transporter periplasmic adaptor subunit [Chitinophagaceae bacterium]
MKIFISVLVSMVFLISCKNKKITATTKSDTYYTCSMHPQVMQDKPGDCPICGMKLIEAKKNSSDTTNAIMLSDQQIQLGNISIDTIKNGSIGEQIVLPATLNMDQNKTNSISARISGRIDKLYYKNLGEYIPKNTKLAEIYSEELNNAKQEYIMALQKQKTFDNALINFSQLISSAKNKLLLWGMTEGQVNQLATEKKFSSLTTIYSTARGYITAINVNEGAYVPEGGTLISVADLSTLWAEAQVYSSQYSLINKNASVFVQFPDYPEKNIKGKIDFANPEISSGTRINLIRVIISNPGNQLKPGMQAYVTIKNKENRSLLLPTDAVIRDSKSASVWIKTGENTFINRMVDVGIENDGRIEIRSGLKSGDLVVISGAYLLNSEYIFKKGADPMAGMDMSNMKM